MRQGRVGGGHQERLGRAHSNILDSRRARGVNADNKYRICLLNDLLALDQCIAHSKIMCEPCSRGVRLQLDIHLDVGYCITLGLGSEKKKSSTIRFDRIVSIFI